MSPRRPSDSSYPAQFRTRYLVLYFGVTLLFVRAAIVVLSRGLASESTVEDPAVTARVDTLFAKGGPLHGII